jgi:RND family efflux transporter MFP subunit
MNRKVYIVTSFVFLAAVLCPSSTDAQSGVEAITVPSADITLSFVQPGQIAEIPPKEGDSVKVGQVLVRQDDAVDQVRLEILEVQSESTSQLEASRATLGQKKIDLEKLEWAAERRAATEQEVAHATLDVRIAELGLEIAEFDHKQHGRQYLADKTRVDNMALKSPIDGRVEQLFAEVGESVSSAAPVVRVVQIDPLWIDVHVSLSQAMSLESGQTAQVVFPDDPENPVLSKIIFIAAVADAGSSTLRIRLEVSNESHRPAGQHVTILFGKITKTD